MARRWQWLGDRSFQAIAAGAAETQAQVLASSVIGKGDTVARILGSVIVMKSVASTGLPLFGCGLMLLDDGVLTVPRPRGDEDHAWLWHMTGHLPPITAGSDFSPARFMVDVHGMRKVEGGKRLVFIMEADPAVGLTYGYGLRVGLKMP